MKRFVIVMAVWMVAFAGFALAEDIKIDNRNTVTATGGNAASNQNQNQDQEQHQGQAQDASSKAVVTSPREHITAFAGVAGAIAPVAPIIADGKWHELLCDEYTIEELENMKDSSSYTNREGFYLINLFTSPLEKSVRVKQYNGEVKSDAVVRLVPDYRGNKVVAEYNGSGAKGAPLSSIVAYAALEGVHDTGQLTLVVRYRARDVAELRGVAFGSGAAGAVSSPDSVRSGSMAVGAVIGSSEASAKYVYDIQVKVVKPCPESLMAMRAACFPPVETAPPCPPKEEKVAPPPPPAPPKAEEPCPPEEEKPICSPEKLAKILKDIRRLEIEIKGSKELGIKGCPTWCKRNMCLHTERGNRFLDAFACTRERKYINAAIKEFEIAERNYFYSGLYLQHDAEIDTYLAANVDKGLAAAIYQRDKSDKAYYKQTWEKSHKVVHSKIVVTHKMIVEVRSRLESFPREINP